MRLRESHVSAIAAVVGIFFAVGANTALAQGVPASISQADRDAAAEVIATGHYGGELTPTQLGVTKGPSAFVRLGEAANPPAPQSPIEPFTFGPTPAWGPVDLYNYGGLTIKSWKQWNVYLGCPANNESCWGNPEQFIRDLNGSRFIHMVDQYVGSTALKRYPLSNTYIYGSPGTNFLSYYDTLTWLNAAVDTAATLGGGIANVTGPGNIYHLYFNQGTDVCADQFNMQCYSPDNLSTFAFCGYHFYADFGGAYGRVYFTVEPYQMVDGCFSSAPDLTSATANVLSHEIFEAITDPDIDAWQGTGNPIANGGEEIGDQCVWVHLYPQKLNFLHPAYVTQNEYSNKYHSCANKP